MVLGDVATYFIGLMVEHYWGSQPSLIVFLFCYFFFLWVAWVIAVRLTEPRNAETTVPTGQAVS
jgi:hypothetical protein